MSLWAKELLTQCSKCYQAEHVGDFTAYRECLARHCFDPGAICATSMIPRMQTPCMPACLSLKWACNIGPVRDLMRPGSGAMKTQRG